MLRGFRHPPPKLLLYVGIFCFCVAAVCTVELAPNAAGVSVLSGALRLLELRSYDVRDDILHGRPRASGQIVIVQIDDASVARLGRFPFRRSDIAQAVERLGQAGAAVIAIDMEFHDRTTAADDDRLARTVATYRHRVALANGFNENKQWRPLVGDLCKLVFDARLGDGCGPPLAIAEVDGSKRRIPLVWNAPAAVPFCVVVAGRALGARPRTEPGAIVVGSRVVPYGYDGTIIVRTPNYRAEGCVVSFLDVLNGTVPRQRLDGKIALLSPPHDKMIDPDEAPGFVQASAIEQVLHGRPAIHVPPAVVCVTSAVVVLALLLVFYRQTWWKSLPAALVFLVMYAGVTLFLLAIHRLWLDLVVPMAAALCCIALAGLGESFRLKSFFSRLFPQELGQSLLESADTRNLGDALEAARAMSTLLDADALLERLRMYLSTAVPHGCGAIHVLGETDEKDAIVRRWFDPMGSLEASLPASAESALVDRVRESGVPLLIDDARQQMALAARGAESMLSAAVLAEVTARFRSLLALPLLSENQAIGVMWVADARPHAFSRTHRDLVMTLSYQVGALLRNAQLHRQVVGAHKALAESKAQLLQSSKLAAVGQLAAGVAHEINNPLGAVSLNLDASMLALDGGSDKVRRKLELCKQALGRVRSIVEKLLDYSRPHEVKEEVSLDRVASDAIELLRHGLEERGVSSCLEAGDVPPVCANHYELQQVVMNLLLNAQDAVTGDGVQKKEIYVVTRVDGDEAVLEVTDSGGGIPPHLVERIFEPFFTTKPVGQGTGLGLWVSRKIAAEQGAAIEVDTREGGPTTFRLRVPCARTCGPPTPATPE